MLGNDELGQAAYVVALGILARLAVVLGAVNEAHDVGVLLDGSRLAEVAELRTLVVALLGGAVELRQGYDGNIQFLGQLLERARNGAHLLLAAAKLEAGGVHQLQVVDDDDLHVVFAHEAAGLGAQLEYRQRRGVVDVERCGIQVFDASHQLVPLKLRQLTALDFLALDFAHVAYEAVHELEVRHLEREYGHWLVEVYGHVFGHRQHKSRLTHCGARGDDDEVAVLPARRDFVEVVKTCLQAAEAVGAVRRLLDFGNGLANYGVDLHHVALKCVFRNFEKLALGLLHKVVNVDGFVESQRANLRAVGDELARQIFLRNDACVVFHIGGRRHTRGEFGDAHGPAGLFKVALLAQLLGDGEHVDGPLLYAQRLYGLIYHLVGVFVEALGLQDVAHHRVGVLLEHERTQHGLLHFGVLWLFFAEFAQRLLFGARLAHRGYHAAVVVFCHFV